MHFGTDLWPLIAKEVESVYYGDAADRRGPRGRRERLRRPVPGRRRRARRERSCWTTYGIAADDRWDWERRRPAVRRTGRFTGRGRLPRTGCWTTCAEDVRDARAGNVSGPLKAALDVLRDLRNEIRLVVDHGGLEGNSYRDELDGWYTPLNAFLSIGPPASRIEELHRADRGGRASGSSGPGMRVARRRPDRPGVRRRVRRGAGRAGRGPRVADRGPAARAGPAAHRRPAAARTCSTTGQCRPYRIPGTCGTSYETGGLAVTERPYRLLDADGRAHPRRFAYGVPTEAVHWVTAAGIRPGVDSVTLGDSDAIARAVLALPPAARPPARACPGGRLRA